MYQHVHNGYGVNGNVAELNLPLAGRLWGDRVDHGQKLKPHRLPALVHNNCYNAPPLHSTGNTSRRRFGASHVGHMRDLEQVSAARAYNATAKIEDAWLKQLDRRKRTALQGPIGRLPRELRASVLVGCVRPIYTQYRLIMQDITDEEESRSAHQNPGYSGCHTHA